MKEWFKDVAIKTIKTMAQSAIAVISTSALITEVNWKVVVSTVALSGVMCVLMNISQIEVKELDSNVNNEPMG